ncbi:MAG: hypothetical protein IJN32_07965 [Thermoguttaceae bacterium]|nr:hypothetical protein [Thermoguttaceae bacterium]
MPKTTENNNAPRRPTPEEYRAARRRVQRETTRVVKRTLVGIALFAGMYYLFLATNARRVEPPTEPEAPQATADAAVETSAPEAPTLETNAENVATPTPATP